MKQTLEIEFSIMVANLFIYLINLLILSLISTLLNIYTMHSYLKLFIYWFTDHLSLFIYLLTSSERKGEGDSHYFFKILNNRG